MRRQLAHAGAWLAATGAAGTVSWFGVHAVLTGAAHDPPRAVPLAAPAGEPEDIPAPDASSTRRPPADGEPTDAGEPREEEGTSPADTDASAGGPPGGPETPGASVARPPSAAPPGDVETVATAGGRAVFDVGPGSCALVSATPEHGWEMRVWTQEQWIRVTFSSGEGAHSVFCTWHGHEPVIETHEE